MSGCVTWTMSLRHFTALRGRYWDRTSDHIDHVPQLVEIPAWFLIYTKWQIFFKLDTKELT